MTDWAPREVGVGRWSLGVVAVVLLALAACSTSTDPTTTPAPSTSTTTTTAISTTATTTTAISTTTTTTTTTTSAPIDVATPSFDIGVGVDGVTYDLDGSPPSGPSSFAVLDDGSVVIADTMAVARGEPRLLHYDRSGELRATIDLAGEEVAAIVDVVSDGASLAILDVLVAMNRYRVVTLGLDGEVRAAVDIPEGFRFEDGLTGLALDDVGILLEFEFGNRYARIADTGVVESGAVPVFDGTRVELIPGTGRFTQVDTSGTSFSIERTTDLGGVTLVGVSPDGSIVVVVDEVDVSGPAIAVKRRVQRYSADGQYLAEHVLDAADQFVEIHKPLELDATGNVLRLRAWPDRLAITTIDV